MASGYEQCRAMDISTEKEFYKNRCSFLMAVKPDMIGKNMERDIFRSLVGDEDFEFSERGATPSRDKDLGKRISSLVHEGTVHPVAKPYLFRSQPLGNLLLDDLIATTDGWRHPGPSFLTNRMDSAGYQDDSCTKLCVREIVMREDLDPGAFDQLVGIMKKEIENDLHKFNAPHLAFGLQTISIDARDKDFLFEKAREVHSVSEHIETPRLNGHHARDQFPCSFTLGNGHSWMVRIRFPIVVDYFEGRNMFYFNFTKLAVLREEWLNFFSTLPPLIGIDVQRKLSELKSVLASFFGLTEVVTPTTVDLKSMSLVAGYDLKKNNLFVLNLLCTGTIFNREVSSCDNELYRRWAKLKKCFKNFLVSELRAIDLVYIVLLGGTLRNFFPDPAPLCNVLERRQSESLAWFSSILTQCITGTLPSSRPWCTDDRRRLIQELKVEDETPQRVDFLAHMAPDFLHWTIGGCRDLHYARQVFSRQVFMLSKLDFHHGKVVEYRPAHCNPYLTFNREGVSQNVAPVREAGLLANPEFESSIFDPHDEFGQLCFTSAHILNQRDLLGRSLVDMLTEWCRLNPKQFQAMMTHLSQVDLFTPEYYKVWVQNVSIYESLYNLHLFIFDVAPTPVNSLEKLIYNRRTVVQDQEIGTMVRTANRLMDIEARVQILKTSAQQASSVVKSQVHVQGQAYRLVPGNNAGRNKKWRDARKKRIQRKLRDGRFTYDPNWKLNKLKAARDARPRGLATAPTSPRRSPTPHSSRRSPTPHSSRRSPTPHPSRRSPTIHHSDRSRSPMTSRRDDYQDVLAELTAERQRNEEQDLEIRRMQAELDHLRDIYDHDDRFEGYRNQQAATSSRSATPEDWDH